MAVEITRYVLGSVVGPPDGGLSHAPGRGIAAAREGGPQWGRSRAVMVGSGRCKACDGPIEILDVYEMVYS